MPTTTDAKLAAFANRLNNALVKKGWNGSDLARNVALQMPDKTFGRDNISRYRRALTIPKPEHIYAMAKALGISPNDLYPEGFAANDHTPPATPEVPAMSMVTKPDGKVELTIKQSVDMDTALKIVGMLRGTHQ